MEKRLLIVDGHAYAYRAFYAIRQLTSPSGQPTNAIYGFIRMFEKMKSQLQPTHILVVWDGGLAAERMQLLPEYKTQRPPMPESLAWQLDEITKFLIAANTSSLHREGMEADDGIATVSRLAVEQGFSVVIASSDKDFMQLVAPKVGLLNPNDKELKVWTTEDVKTKTGVEPGQIVDWLALVGDSVDNIAGVPGIGTTTATKLLQQFGSTEQMFVRLEEISSIRLRESLQASQEIVCRNRLMIKLYDHLPEMKSCDEFVLKTPDDGMLKELYAGWGFKKLLEEMEKKMAGQGELL